MASPPKVLHIIENFDTGAVENWLLTMMRTARSAGVPLDWTFYCVLPRKGQHDEEARALGATVLHSRVELRKTRAFLVDLRKTMKAGRFDVLHCHHDIVSALYLIAAAGVRIRLRIVHAHNADLGVPTPNRVKAALLRPLLRHTCVALADRVVGISNITLQTILGRSPRSGTRERVLYYGISTERFHGEAPDRDAMRRELALPPTSRILLFAGRMVWYKNPLFLVAMLESLRHVEPQAVAVFVGSGPLEDEVRKRAIEAGIQDSVRVLGWRDDSAALMRIADLFVFPRVEESSPGFGIEGLGLVVVEAQAAGLPALLSRGIPTDAVVLPDQCHFLSLTQGVEQWSEAARHILLSDRPSQSRSVGAVDDSHFSAKTGLAELVQLHVS